MTKGSKIGDVLAGREPAHASSRPAFVDLDRMTSVEGLVAVISMRRANGLITFGIFREFERDGHPERTTFIPETMIDAYVDFVDLVKKRVLELRGNVGPSDKVISR